MKKRLFSFCLGIIAAVTMSIFVAGCGESQPPINVDKAPFEKAIAQYCRSKNYGMKIKEFVSLQAKSGTAIGLCKMQEAGGLYGMAVKWQFQFKKGNKGGWEVTGHEAK
jgi:hypothetical protein